MRIARRFLLITLGTVLTLNVGCPILSGYLHSLITLNMSHG